MPEKEEFKEKILKILKKVKYPGYSRDIVSFGMVKKFRFEGDKLTVHITMKGVEDSGVEQIKKEALTVLKAESGFSNVEVALEIQPKEQDTQAHQPMGSRRALEPKAIPGVKAVLAVSSGKGGVGKSTVAVNLACVAAKQGLKVGILDSDIHGPSLPTLLGIYSQPEANNDGILPFEKYGIKAMSIGFLIESGQPLIWRGPMVNQALQQLYDNTLWGDLDVLLLDLPPGTGDVQITLAQNYKIDGAIIVTTPQNLALEDVKRGTVMFQHTGVQVLGIAENMSYYRCPDCQSVTKPFGEGGGERIAEELAVKFLGKIPMDPKARELADRGIPVVIDSPDSEIGQSFIEIWKQIYQILKQKAAS
jgi:ATP-binding protein involved in chromosome partitioning